MRPKRPELLHVPEAPDWRRWVPGPLVPSAAAQFGIAWAPAGWTGLLDHLRVAGHSDAVIQVLEQLINQGEADLVDSLDPAARQGYWQVGDRAADQRSARALRRMTGRRGSR